MTRIETALARMFRDSDVPAIDHRQWPVDMLATPTGKALSAYLEAADTAVDAYGSDAEWDAMAVLAVARTTFRAATEPQT